MGEQFQVSARKFRPETFTEIVGQPHIVQTLTNQIKNNRIGHAYIFSGTRGVGKTSTARVLAKALNCVEGTSVTPCLKCDACENIALGRYIDVIEIDGASNRGIDNIKEIRENTKFAPITARYKIYIIDEVHQVTKDAFNALLKTLEEPPLHVVFIFATTLLTKVPDTILSRCQSFEFRTISINSIASQLEFIAKQRGIDIDPSAIKLLAKRGKGSMRDAQSLFDQTVSYSPEKLSVGSIKEILGLVDRKILVSTLELGFKKDVASLFELGGELANSGADLFLFCEELSELISDLVRLKVNRAFASNLEESEQKLLTQIATSLTFDEITYWFDTVERLTESIGSSLRPELNLEMGIIRLANYKNMVQLDDLIVTVDAAVSKSKHLDKIVSSATPLATEKIRPVEPKATVAVENRELGSKRTPSESTFDDEAKVENRVGEVDESIDQPKFEIVKEEFEKIPDDLLDSITDISPQIMGILSSRDKKLTADALIVTVENKFEVEILNEQRQKIETILSRNRLKKMRFVVKLKDDLNKNLIRKQKQIKAKRSEVKEKLLKKPIIQETITMFDPNDINIEPDKDKI